MPKLLLLALRFVRPTNCFRLRLRERGLSYSKIEVLANGAARWIVNDPHVLAMRGSRVGTEVSEVQPCAPCKARWEIRCYLRASVIEHSRCFTDVASSGISGFGGHPRTWVALGVGSSLRTAAQQVKKYSIYRQR